MLSLLIPFALARPLFFAHYMPWFQSKPFSGQWGWHWTMNHFDPSKLDSQNEPEIASHFVPLIGPYDSADPDTLECQTLLMKFAGLDGVFIDWYGTQNLYDYATVNHNTEAMIAACTKAKLKFSIVMEDQVVPQLIKHNVCTADAFGQSALAFLQKRFFNLPGYLHWHHQPVLLMFGPQYYSDAQLNSLFGKGAALFTLSGVRGPAVGAFGWPAPQVGNEKSWDQIDAFYMRAKQWPASVAIAYPRFDDIYKQAGVGPGYGSIADDDGKTLTRSLALAVASHAPWVQIATWNDWGEGTQIEPSTQFRYRDLEAVQAQRKTLDPSFAFTAEDLRLPILVYKLRKAGADAVALNKASADLFSGNCDAARAILDHLKP